MDRCLDGYREKIISQAQSMCLRAREKTYTTLSEGAEFFLPIAPSEGRERNCIHDYVILLKKMRLEKTSLVIESRHFFSIKLGNGLCR